MTKTRSSAYRVEKQRTDAVLTMSSGQSIRGFFFIAGASARHAGPERVAELLNAESGFLPFEKHDGASAQTIICNRSHVVMVSVPGDEARLDSGYDQAPRHDVSVLLSTGDRVEGAVRVYMPEGRDRLSDWTRQPEMFRYLETSHATLILNVLHVVEVREITGG